MAYWGFTSTQSAGYRFDKEMSIGSWGYTGEHFVVPEASANINAGLGIYSMVNYAATAGKVFAGSYSRLLNMTADQPNLSTMVGLEAQYRLRDVDIANGVHAGIWAYAEQSGTSAMTGTGTFDGISASVESEAGFSALATNHITGGTFDSSINAGATINAAANFSAIYVKSNGLDWFNGIRFSGVDIDIRGQNDETIDNATDGSWDFGTSNILINGLVDGIDIATDVAANTLKETDAHYENTLVVAKSGGDYATIQGAIDAITDNAANKPYVVLIHPGTYTEDITMEDFVSLDGVGRHDDIVIDGTVTFAADAADRATIKDLSVVHTTTTTGLSLVTSPNSTGFHGIDNVTLHLANTDNGDVGTLLTDAGGVLDVRYSYFEYDFDGSAAGTLTHEIIALSGTMIINIHDSEFAIEVDDVDDTVIGINGASGGVITEEIIKNCIFHFNINNVAYSGTSGIFYLHGTGTEKEIENNHIHLSSAGNGTGYIFYMDTAAGGGVINSIGNRAIVEGFTNNYAGNVAVGDVLNARFNSLNAASGFTGAGTVNAVISSSAGALSTTGLITSNGGLTFPDLGSSVNSATFTMVADNAGTPQTGTFMLAFGANPYFRLSAPNAAGAATVTMDMRSDAITWFNGLADTDYYFTFNGETNDGTITYMEDEDRFDFDNDVSVGGNLYLTNSMASDLDMGDYEIILDSTPDTDHTASGLKIELTAGEVLNIGDIGYQNADGEIYLADATDATKMPGMFMCIETASDGVASDFLMTGVVRDDTWNWTVDDTVKILYASTTGGAMQEAVVSGAGDISQAVGLILSADKIMFCPTPVMASVASA